MPATTHTLTFGAAGGGNTQSGIQCTSTGVSTTEVYETIAVSTTNQLQALAIAHAKLQSLFIYATAALTLKFNSSGSPDITWVLAANTPLVWASGMPYPTSGNPLGSVDVASVYITNASSTTAADIYILANQSA